MQRKFIFTLLVLACLIAACGEKFDYQHKYTGSFAVTDSVWISETMISIRGGSVDVYEGNEGELVFRRAEDSVIVMQIDKKGVMKGSDEWAPLKGYYINRNHFRYSRGADSPQGIKAYSSTGTRSR